MIFNKYLVDFNKVLVEFNKTLVKFLVEFVKKILNKIVELWRPPSRKRDGKEPPTEVLPSGHLVQW